ncbi:hypothetical protein UYSO10_2480 [Kosakonia radicincitans]|uniref:helix-turn-helix transcriptional regulator n=1 Tax=Kosakonia radicincitans TaxID=283686 RepID=UPI0011831BE3|nr:helix-turn-helix domain-containing protein [Kosakonia radicincitans]VVT48740.1 hypothetical protein UYSO10_2480 [Kosakonia radicincitans]
MNDIVDRIANGQAELLGIDDICKRLGVSRTTLDRWVQNGRSVGYGLGLTAFNQESNTLKLARKAMGSRGLGLTSSLLDESSADKTVFPEPDIRIGNSPKWEMSTFKEWLKSNAKK